MYHIIIALVSLVLTTIFVFILYEKNYRMGEVLGMYMIFPMTTFGIIIALEFGYFIWKRKVLQDNSTMPTDQNNGLKLINTFNDLYFFRHNSNDDFIDFRIESCDKKVFMHAKCQLSQQKIYTIDLYSEIYKQKIIKVISQSDSSYLIINNQMKIGFLREVNGKLCFEDLDNERIYLATLTVIDSEEKEMDLVMSLVTLEASASYVKQKYLLIKQANDETVGKYFYNLHNLYMDTEENCELDKNIAIIFSIISEVNFKL